MVLSAETLEERYGQLEGAFKIQRMIEDMVDVSVIMTEVRAYGKASYERGISDGVSRSQSRPGFGDMGG